MTPFVSCLVFVSFYIHVLAYCANCVLIFSLLLICDLGAHLPCSYVLADSIIAVLDSDFHIVINKMMI